MRMAALDAAGHAYLQRDHRRAPPTLDEAEAEARRQRLGQRDEMLAARYARNNLPHQPAGFGELIETQRHARGDIALAAQLSLHPEHIVGRTGQIAAQIEGLSAGAAGQARKPEPPRSGDGHRTGAAEAILHAVMLLEQRPQPLYVRRQSRHLPVECLDARGIDIHAHASGHDEVE